MTDMQHLVTKRIQPVRRKRRNWRCFLGWHDWSEWKVMGPSIYVVRMGVPADQGLGERRCERCGESQLKDVRL